MLKSLFNKVADLKTCKFIKKRLQHRCHEKEITDAVVCRYSSKKAFLKKLRKFYRKIPVLASPFNKVAGLKTCNFVKNRFQHRCFPAKFEKFKNTFFAEHLRWPLLKLNICFNCCFITYQNRKSRLLKMRTM